MRRAFRTQTTIGTLLIGAALVIAAESDVTGQSAAPARAFVCSNDTLAGTFGLQMQGTGPGPGGVSQALIGVVIRTYDGVGGFSQIDNIKGAVTGIVPDRPGVGTYHVNADCTGTATVDPGAGFVVQEKFVIVDRGDEIRSIVSSPQPLMITTVGKRIGVR